MDTSNTRQDLPRQYDPRAAEPRWQGEWERNGTYRFPRERRGAVYAVDTPPATASGDLHLGHVLSYSQTDFLARFHRMRGERVYYPMGYDDNGLPTERMVEKRLGVRARDMDRRAFAEKCLEISRATERQYEALWRRLGLSVDWRYSYRTIDEGSRRISQRSFLELYRKGRVYRQEAPALWCTECRTAVSQADLNDLTRKTVFHTLAFAADGGEMLSIATTRPELLPACVAVMVHPDDSRFRRWIGRTVRVPRFGREVPVLADAQADPQTGTGVVMVCTFGDAMDVEWWRSHQLPLIEALDRDGRLTSCAAEFAGLPAAEARARIADALGREALLLDRRESEQTVRVHERCDTPIEYIVTPQWFIRLLDLKDDLLDAGDGIRWRPESMKARYRQWVENLGWDWCISRQRAYGVPFPLWHCHSCDEVLLASEEQLPVDPTETAPPGPCACGDARFEPERDVFDTWATSSMTPQIAGRKLTDPELYEEVFPMSLRPQAHEIIRTWAFYTIFKSIVHEGRLPWKEIAISGWALAPEGAGKISKSRGGGPVAPLEMIERYSADAVRYWAASAALGRDVVISEQKIQQGQKLVTKLWNVARFCAPFLADSPTPEDAAAPGPDSTEPAARLTAADRWILSRAQRVIRRATELWQESDYAAALHETEAFFWTDLADNYLEMAKQRLYANTPAAASAPEHRQQEAFAAERCRQETVAAGTAVGAETAVGTESAAGAREALRRALRTVLQLLAPVLPHVTEEISRSLGLRPGRDGEGPALSLHESLWPEPEEDLVDTQAEAAGASLIEIATAVRRYKSERGIAQGSPLALVQIVASDGSLRSLLEEAIPDLRSVTRAARIEFVDDLPDDVEPLEAPGSVRVGLRT